MENYCSLVETLETIFAVKITATPAIKSLFLGDKAGYDCGLYEVVSCICEMSEWLKLNK